MRRAWKRAFRALELDPGAAEQPTQTDDLHELQRRVGNRALQRALEQRRRFSSAREPTEIEAERVATRVAAVTSDHVPPPAIDRVAQPLERDVQTFVEAQLGHGLNDVRVHTGNDASAAARAAGADAFTVGSDVVFGEGKYAPHTSEGRGLIAHEAAHVVQQRGGAGGREPLSAAPRGVQRQQAQVTEEQRPSWYQRAAAFSSGLEVLGRVLAAVSDEVEREQSEWYVVSDRVFTRPVVDRVLADANAFHEQVAKFIADSPADDPLLAQLKADLALFDSEIARLQALRPENIGWGEAAGRHFVGGVTGAAGSFLGFLRLGLWDSWGQFVFDGSERRIDEAQEGMMQMMLDVHEQGFGTYAGRSWEQYTERLERSEAEQQHITSGGQVGGTLFDIYFAGRGLVSAASGVRQVSRAAAAFRALENPAPWRAAIRLGVREATSFRGAGLYGPGTQTLLPRFPGRPFLGSSFGLPQSGPTVPLLRVIRSDEDLVAKMFREPNTLVLDKAGNFRPISDIVRQHISSSGGSPLQSALPTGDVETMLAANPQNFGVARAPYYVIVEVPQGRGLISANELVVGRGGVDPSQFPEFQVNRFGVQMPEDLRPPTLADYQAGNLSPEAQLWVQQQFGFGPGSAAAENVLNAGGIPFYEWEQLALAPDLRPYVTSVQPNPLFGGPRTPIGARAGIPPIYDPALNPQSLYGLGEGGVGWGRVQTYFDWISARSAAGDLGFTPSEIGGAQRVTFLGGRPLFTPVGALPVSVGQPPPQPEVSPQALQRYLAWVAATVKPPSGLFNTAQASVAGSGQPTTAPGAAADVGQQFGTVAAQIRQVGGKVTGLRLGPNTGFLEVHVATTDLLHSALQAAVGGLLGANADFGIGLSITIDSDPGVYETLGGIAELGRMVRSLSPPPQLRVVLRARDGRVLFSGSGEGP